MKVGWSLERVVEKERGSGLLVVHEVYIILFTSNNPVNATVQCIECFFTVNHSTQCIVYYQTVNHMFQWMVFEGGQFSGWEIKNVDA